RGGSPCGVVKSLGSSFGSSVEVAVGSGVGLVADDPVRVTWTSSVGTKALFSEVVVVPLGLGAAVNVATALVVIIGISRNVVVSSGCSISVGVGLLVVV